MDQSEINTIHWFRKGLRLHDNPAILAAVEGCKHFWPIFILDPWFIKNTRIGFNRWRFLIESLRDLDRNLRKLNSRLFVLRGNPTEIFPIILQNWKVKRLTYERDTEPYSKSRDEEIDRIAESMGVEVIKKTSNTLYNPDRIIAHHGSAPMSYKSFVCVVEDLGPPAKPVAPLTDLKGCTTPVDADHDTLYALPTFEEVNVNPASLTQCLYPGGETEALRRLEHHIVKKSWICRFEKNHTDPNSISPSTTVLSPYVKFGCLSIRTFYHKVQEVYDESKIGYSKPPTSLHGQLFWREFFYTTGYTIPNFDKMAGNPICRQIAWDVNKKYLDAWTNAETGFPFIDAVMTQLRQEGWVHHLARHSVACFLTRGDLWLSWENGLKVFEELLIDADWSLNAGNWLWLSASAFFCQYYRVYSPIAFGKKTDKQGQYIKKYVPILKKFPPDYIYEPWKAPLKVQQQAGCIIGQDYPLPIVDHDRAKTRNLELMAAAYRTQKVSKIDPALRDRKPKKETINRPAEILLIKQAKLDLSRKRLQIEEERWNAEKSVLILKKRKIALQIALLEQQIEFQKET